MLYHQRETKEKCIIKFRSSHTLCMALMRVFLKHRRTQISFVSRFTYTLVSFTYKHKSFSLSFFWVIIKGTTYFSPIYECFIRYSGRGGRQQYEQRENFERYTPHSYILQTESYANSRHGSYLFFKR